MQKYQFVPIYKQIKEDLIKDFRTKKPGDSVFAEEKLAIQYGVSPMTIRRALSELTYEGYITRIRKKGTFIKVPTMMNTKKTIGILHQHVGLGIFPILLEAIENKAYQEGYDLVLNNVGNDFAKQNEIADILVSRKVNGVIFIPVENNDGYDKNIFAINKLVENNIHVIQVDRYVENTDTDYIVTDNFQGAYKIVEHLIQNGHRKIGMISGEYSTTVNNRVEGYKKALSDNGITVDLNMIKIADLTIDKSEYTATKSLLEHKPTAIFALNDLVALSVMKTLKQEQLKVPGDISLVGYDNLPVSELLDPPLTTVAQPIHEMGEKAVEILINRIKGVYRTKQKIVLESKLVIRDSVNRI
jgi:LacI family transcriptional regulator